MQLLSHRSRCNYYQRKWERYNFSHFFKVHFWDIYVYRINMQSARVFFHLVAFQAFATPSRWLRNWTGKLNWNNMKETFRFCEQDCTAFFRVSCDTSEFFCLIVSKVINFLVYMSFPSSFLFSPQLHLTDSVRTCSRVHGRSVGEFMVDRQHMAIYRNPLNYFYTILYDTLLCTRQSWIQISSAIHHRSGNISGYGFPIFFRILHI